VVGFYSSVYVSSIAGRWYCSLCTVIACDVQDAMWNRVCGYIICDMMIEYYVMERWCGGYYEMDSELEFTLLLHINAIGIVGVCRYVVGRG
jgi:hypothetical protein